MKLGIGIYGMNAHQIYDLNHNNAQIVASAACGREWDGVKNYETLEQMLADSSVQLVSLCSPCRADQARQAIQCMEAGRHVYAEKPCAMTTQELDEIMATAKRTGKVFHEMASTAFEEPYYTMREIVSQGQIGEVIQVFAQKSYPYHDRRPQDENIDAGLICQNGIHAIRFIEHVAGKKVTSITATQTPLGNPHRDKHENGGLQMAASMAMRLEGGGVASCVVNYLNPAEGFGNWGNEHVRIFGTMGFVESVDAGKRTRLVIGNDDKGELKLINKGPSFLDMVIGEALGICTAPLSMEDELHPTRVVIKAKESALKNGEWMTV